MGWSFKASGLLSLFIALVNLGLVLWLWKSRKDYKFLVYTTLGLVLTFVSITVPIQLDGNYITLVWASEMVLLLWLYIKSRIRVYEYAAKILVGLTFISYLMDIYSVVMHEHHAVSTIFLNSSFATSLFVGLATGAFALLIGYYRPFFSTARQLKYGFWNPFMLFVSVAILYYTFMMEFHLHFEGATRSGAMFLFTAIAISSVCYAFRKRFPITQYLTFYISYWDKYACIHHKYMGRSMGEHGFCACCTAMVHGSICNSEYILCGTPILSINRHQESFHYLSQYSGHSSLGDNGTLFPLAGRSR